MVAVLSEFDCKKVEERKRLSLREHREAPGEMGREVTLSGAKQK